MAKKGQIERAIEALEAKKRAVEDRAQAECDALAGAIDELKAQRAKPARKAKMSRVLAAAAVNE